MQPITDNYVPRRGTYSFCLCSRAAWGVRSSPCPIISRKSYLDIFTNFFLHVYGVNSLAGIDFQQFLKNKMAATAIFLLTQNSDDVRSIKGKVMNISSPNVLYGYKVAYAWLVLIFSNFWKTRWPPQPIFCWLRILTTSYQLKEKLWIYHHHMFYVDIRWHKLGWYWFSTISEKQNGRYSQFSADSEFWWRPIN